MKKTLQLLSVLFAFIIIFLAMDLVTSISRFVADTILAPILKIVSKIFYYVLIVGVPLGLGVLVYENFIKGKSK
jgi:hypothetical protein